MSIETDAEKMVMLRDIAEEVRAEPDGEQVGALLYRVSDLYDPEEETSVQEIYLNMRYILGVKEQGGIGR